MVKPNTACNWQKSISVHIEDIKNSVTRSLSLYLCYFQREQWVKWWERCYKSFPLKGGQTETAQAFFQLFHAFFSLFSVVFAFHPFLFLSELGEKSTFSRQRQHFLSIIWIMEYVKIKIDWLTRNRHCCGLMSCGINNSLCSNSGNVALWLIFKKNDLNPTQDTQKCKMCKSTRNTKCIDIKKENVDSHLYVLSKF